ncbi:glycosyltransferase, partial [Alicyclobacillus fastidiosus]
SKSIHRSLGETFIHLVGNQKLLRNYLGLGDLVVGTGRVALESMACGKPVLAIGTRGFFGMVTPSLYPSAWDYYFGDHFADQTPTEDLIAESLLLALLDREALKVIGRQGREWVMDNFNIHKISRQIAEIYSNVQHSNQMNRGIV